MPEVRVSRKGRVLGDFSLEDVIEGAQSGSFLPSDDVLPKGSSAWTKMDTVEGVTFPKATVPPVVVGSAPPRPPEYASLYRSSDQKMLTGFCGGVAHRLGVQPGVARFVFVVLVIITGSIAGWVYFLSLLLPKLPTRDVA